MCSSDLTVTQLVQQLEARLHVRLLNRTTRQVKVTADGVAYYERVVRLLADMVNAETSLSSAAAVPRGGLRVDVPSPLARLILVPAWPAFHARYPGHPAQRLRLGKHSLATVVESTQSHGDFEFLVSPGSFSCRALLPRN